MSITRFLTRKDNWVARDFVAKEQWTLFAEHWERLADNARQRGLDPKQTGQRTVTPGGRLLD